MTLPSRVVVLRESAAAREAMGGRLDVVLVSNEEWDRIEAALVTQQSRHGRAQNRYGEAS